MSEKKHICFHVKLHEADARALFAAADKHGVEARELIKIAVVRYLDNLAKNREAPPRRIPSARKSPLD